MSLNATTQGFLKEVESSTGLKVLVEEQGSQLQAPLLAKVQVARRGMPTKGCFVYAVDPGVRELLKQAQRPLK